MTSAHHSSPIETSTQKILVLPGDGIGPEIVDPSIAVLQAADSKFKLGLTHDHEDVGFASLAKHGTALRDEVLQKASSHGGIILGTESHADYLRTREWRPQHLGCLPRSTVSGQECRYRPQSRMNARESPRFTVMPVFDMTAERSRKPWR